MDYDYQRLQMRSEDVVGFHSNLMVERQHKRYWFVKDVCGIICAMMTWGLILYAEFVVMTVILLPNPYPVYSYVNMVIFNMLAFLATASHMRTMFSDPVSGMRAGLSRDSVVTLSSSLSPLQGSVPKGNATQEMIQSLNLREGQIFFKCAKCCSIKPQRAHHCSVCQRCIRKMDHHCPWVRRCEVRGSARIYRYVLFVAGGQLRGRGQSKVFRIIHGE